MKKADKYILLSIILLLVVSIIGVYTAKKLLTGPGATAIITQNGKVIREINLRQISDTYETYEFTIEGANNNYNTIYIEKNKIKFSTANCPDQLCVNTGFLSHANDIAVCLPHGLFIEIQGGAEGEIDTLAH